MLTPSEEPSQQINSIPGGLRAGRKRRPHFEPIDELAISGPDAELVDVVDGRRFLYHFEQEGRPLEEVIRLGIARFLGRYGQLPTMLILAASYGLSTGAQVGGLEVLVVGGLPSYHFWFGPKPDYQQLSFNF